MPRVLEKPPWSGVPLEKSSSHGFRLANGSVKCLLPPQAHSFGGRMCWRDSPADYDGDECEPDALLGCSERARLERPLWLVGHHATRRLPSRWISTPTWCPAFSARRPTRIGIA